MDPYPPAPRAVASSASSDAELRVRHGADHELRDAVAARDGEGRLPVVHQHHLELAAVVGVDGPRRVEHRHPVAQRQPGARAHLALEAGGMATAQPVGTSARSPGARVSGAARAAWRSIPAAPSVW